MLRCAFSAADFQGMDEFEVQEIGEVFVIQNPSSVTGNGNALAGWAQVHLAEDPVGEQCESEGFTKAMYADLGEVWRRADGVLIAATNKVKRRALMVAVNQARECGPHFYTGMWAQDWFVSIPCEPQEPLPVERAMLRPRGRSRSPMSTGSAGGTVQAPAPSQRVPVPRRGATLVDAHDPDEEAAPAQATDISLSSIEENVIGLCQDAERLQKRAKLVHQLLVGLQHNLQAERAATL